MSEVIRGSEGTEQSERSVDREVTNLALSTRKNFARAIIEAVDCLRQQHGVAAFVKLNADGIGGTACMTPGQHGIIYDHERDKEERVTYLREYISTRMMDNQLPRVAAIEEFIEEARYSGGINADIGVCGFMLAGIFFPISINLCATENAMYTDQWASSSPDYLHNSYAEWQRMFQIYSSMTALEAAEFSYHNGIYAGDFFVTKDGIYKHHDWNIRRTARSSFESLIIFGLSGYQTKLKLFMADFGMEGKLSNVELFRLYTKICERLVNDYGIYLITTGYGYCGKDGPKDVLIFQVIVNAEIFATSQSREQPLHRLSHSEDRQKLTEIFRGVVERVLQKQ